MRILASMNFLRGLSQPLVHSLVNSKLVSEVFLVSDIDMLQIPGLQLYHTPKWVKSPFNKLTFRGIFRMITHFIFMLYLTVYKKPDVVIGFHIFPQCVYAFICAKLFRKPVIACMSDWPGQWHFRRKLLPMLQHSDLVTTTGYKTREYLIKQGIKQEKIYVRPNPTDTERFKPFILQKKYDLIFIGRLEKEKNVETLLTIVDQVRSFKTNLKVCIIGDGYLKESLQQMSTNLGITKNVEFLGYKENTEYYINSSKILILTSLHEGLPRVMVEAMACCIPCIVPNVGDVTDAAINGFNALVIEEPTDVQSYTNAILRLLEDTDLYKALSDNTRAITEEVYSLNSATEYWDKILSLVNREKYGKRDKTGR